MLYRILEVEINMLKLSHIKKGYNKKDVLIDVDYTFQEGNIYSLLGGAGAGRTTLFECICGDVPVDEGAIEIPPKAKIFYASKQSILPVYITGYEFISMLCDISDENIKPEAVFEKVGFSIGQRDKLIVDYTFEEKKIIFSKFALPKVLKRMSLKEQECIITDEALNTIVDLYSGTSGIRDLEQAAEHIAANALYQIEVDHLKSVTFDAEMVRKLLI